MIQVLYLFQKPVFSHQGGFYTGAFKLELTTNEPGVKIYYTTDGSDPVPGNREPLSILPA